MTEPQYQEITDHHSDFVSYQQWHLLHHSHFTRQLQYNHVFICTERLPDSDSAVATFSVPISFPSTHISPCSPAFIALLHTHTNTHQEHIQRMAISLFFEEPLWSCGTRIDRCSDELVLPEPRDYLSLNFKQSAKREGLTPHHSLTLSHSVRRPNMGHTHTYIHTNGNNETSLHSESQYLRQAEPGTDKRVWMLREWGHSGRMRI